MEELGSLWSYQENIDEMKQKLMYNTIELESMKMEAIEEMRKHKEDVKRLLDLLKIAYQERDEARLQLQKLVKEIIPSSPTKLQHAILPHVQPESPLVIQAKANSSITESNSLSETYNNHQSHVSSSVDSFFDAVSSPDFSNINMIDSGQMGFVNQSFVGEYNGSMSTGLISSGMANVDPANAVIDNLVKGKTLPQKGKLLQAVMDAGPLLQTLLVAGPLPRWRNPPPLQPFKIPPVSIKGCEAVRPLANPTSVVQKPLKSLPHLEMNRGSSQACSASMLNFASGPSVSVLSKGKRLSLAACINNQIPASKRQRFY